MPNFKAKLAFLFNFSVLVVCNGVDIVDDEDVDDGDDNDDVSKKEIFIHFSRTSLTVIFTFS